MVLSSPKTMSGERVTPTRALSLPAYFAGLRNISEDLASVPRSVVERLSPRGRRPLDDHVVTRLLHEAFNPHCDAFVGVQTLTHWALAYGNGCAEIELDDRGEITAIWPINPTRIRLTFEGGEPVYVVSVDDLLGESGPPVTYRPEEIFHLRGTGDQWQGWSVVQLQAEALGLGLAARGFAASFFGNATELGAVVTLAGRVPRPEREAFRADLQSHYSGVKRSHGVLVLDNDAKITRLGAPPGDVQLLETQGWSLEDVARILRCPPHKMGHRKQAAGWSTLESENIDYVTDTLIPWAVRWEKEAKRKLMRGESGRSVVFFFQGRLRGDFKTRTEGYRSLIGAGVLTPNEARELEDLNPSSDPGADLLWMQGAMAPISRLRSGPVAPVGPDSGRRDESAGARAAGSMLADWVGRKAASAFTRAAKRHEGDIEAFRAWSAGFVDEVQSDLVARSAPVLEDRGAIWGPAAARRIGDLMIARFCDGLGIAAEEVSASLLASFLEVV